MGYTNMVYEWEGDNSQALTSFTWRGRKELLPKRARFVYGRVIFTEGDLDDYWDLVDARNDVIKRNKAKIAEGSIDGVGGRIGGGFWFGEESVSGDALEVVPAEPSYSGDLALAVKVYVDGTLENTISVYNQKPFRLGVQKRSTNWYFELVGNVDAVHQFDVASSMSELISDRQGDLKQSATDLAEYFTGG